ncbi:hypothetical protein B0H63DRAFT_536095 [Podospora didyma]|uniref:Uncharacterized protein n=1 Tax=Podospora didyma TaxID=330526 RepID=A0AAE0N2Q2_9PEZI|nr:hypothetical protein B0H63DRAFT_536095 [Podospora didyma]
MSQTGERMSLELAIQLLNPNGYFSLGDVVDGHVLRGRDHQGEVGQQYRDRDQPFVVVHGGPPRRANIHTQTLFKRILHIPPETTESWPFTSTIPYYASSMASTNPDHSPQHCFLCVGKLEDNFATRPLPFTFFNSDDVHDSMQHTCVEYLGITSTSSPVPFKVRVVPLPAESPKEVMKLPPPVVRMKSLKLHLTSKTQVLLPGSHLVDEDRTRRRGFGTIELAWAEDDPSAVLPCGEDAALLDVGAAIGLQSYPSGMVHSDIVWPVCPRLFPDFATHNIQHSHNISWELALVVAQETGQGGRVGRVLAGQRAGDQRWAAGPFKFTFGAVARVAVAVTAAVLVGG